MNAEWVIPMHPRATDVRTLLESTVRNNSATHHPLQVMSAEERASQFIGKDSTRRAAPLTPGPPMLKMLG